MKKQILISLIIVFVIIQFFRIDKVNPPYNPNEDFLTIYQAPENISLALKNACYDCHSNETKYPWYTNVAPFSFWIKGHISNARENINFSTWESLYDEKGKAHKIEETIEEIQEGHMPPKSYKWMHPEASLTSQQKLDLISWLETL